MELHSSNLQSSNENFNLEFWQYQNFTNQTNYQTSEFIQPNFNINQNQYSVEINSNVDNFSSNRVESNLNNGYTIQNIYLTSNLDNVEEIQSDSTKTNIKSSKNELCNKKTSTKIKLKKQKKKSSAVKKRKRNENEWKRNKIKHKRNGGEEYQNWSGKLISAKSLRPACNKSCRQKCNEKFSEQSRQTILESFWNMRNIDRQRDYILRFVDIVPKARTRIRKIPESGELKSRRQITCRYHLPSDTGKVKVCQTFFINTLCISSQMVATVKRKVHEGRVLEDKRGRHPCPVRLSSDIKKGIIDHITSFENISISSKHNFFPPSLNIKTVYKDYKEKCAANCKIAASESSYRRILCTEFNIPNLNRNYYSYAEQVEQTKSLKEILSNRTSNKVENDETCEQISAETTNLSDKFHNLQNVSNNKSTNKPITCNLTTSVDMEEEISVDNKMADVQYKKGTKQEPPSKEKRQFIGKRKRNESEWRKNKIKFKRNGGESYKNWSGRLIDAKKIRSSCENCRRKCTEKFTEDRREAIFNSFWALRNIDRQRDFILRFVEIVTKARTRRRKFVEGTESRRKLTYRYYLPSDSAKVSVCKKFFLNTLAISNQMVETVKHKTHLGTVLEDHRGRHASFKQRLSITTKNDVINHINSLETKEYPNCKQLVRHKYLTSAGSINLMYQSYTNECSVRNCLPVSISSYRRIFLTKFNLSFLKPSDDLCDSCEKMEEFLKREYSKMSTG